VDTVLSGAIELGQDISNVEVGRSGLSTPGKQGRHKEKGCIRGSGNKHLLLLLQRTLHLRAPLSSLSCFW